MRVSPESPIEERLEFAGFYLLNMSWAASLTSAPLNTILEAPPSFYNKRYSVENYKLALSRTPAQNSASDVVSTKKIEALTNLKSGAEA